MVEVSFADIPLLDHLFPLRLDVPPVMPLARIDCVAGKDPQLRKEQRRDHLKMTGTVLILRRINSAKTPTSKRFALHSLQLFNRELDRLGQRRSD